MAWQATQRGGALAKKKKKPVKVRRRFEKKEINWWLRGGERREEGEEELESEDPTESGNDVGSSEDKGYEGAIVTLVEHHMPVVAPVDGGHGMETRGDAPTSRKRTTGEDATYE